MAVIGNSFPGLIDIFKSKDPDGSMADILNMLKEQNDMLEDVVMREANNGTSHESTLYTSLPDSFWGRLEKGTPLSKASRKKVKDTTGFVEARSQVDARYKEIEPHFDQFRIQEAGTYLESLSQEMQRALLYEDENVNEDRITGLAPRFNDKSAANGSQIVDAGGTGSDNTSIWFVTWGLDSAFMVHPKGSPVGIQREDHGKQRVDDGSGDFYYAFEETFRWHAGLVVRDWRRIVRIANIDVSDLAADTVDIYKFMRKAMYQGKGFRQMDTVDEHGRGRTSIYCNKGVFEALDAKGTTTSNLHLHTTEIQGKEVMTYRGIPIRQTDQLVNTEAQVT